METILILFLVGVALEKKPILLNLFKGEFFSFRIYKSEISFETVLEVTDFAEDREIKDQIRLWDSQIDQLKHCLGAA